MKVFDKILFKNTLLHISSYHKTTKRRSCYCICKSPHGHIPAEIQKFMHIPKIGTIVFVKPFSKTGCSILENAACRNVLQQYADISLVSQFIIEIFPMSPDAPLICIRLTDIVGMGMLITTNSTVCYFVKVPSNNYEH